MVYASEFIVNQVRQAENEAALKAVLDDFLFQSKRGTRKDRIDRKYTRDVLMALKYHRAREKDEKAIAKLSMAITFFLKVHEQATENLF